MNWKMNEFKKSKTALLIFFMLLIWAHALICGNPAWSKPVISLEDALAIAMENHPSLMGSEGQIAAQRGRLAQSAAGDRPEVSGSISTSRRGVGSGSGTAGYSAGVSASMRIFDANRNRHAIDSQRNTLSAVEEDGRTTLRDVRANVKTAYMTLLFNMEIVGHRLESAQAFEQYLRQAEAFYEVGIAPWFNVTKAEVDLGRAQLALLEAESNVEIAKVIFFNAMGIDRPHEEFALAPIDLEVPYWLAQMGRNSLREAEFLAEALENRSDYRASEFRTLAGAATLRTEARASSPSVSVTGGLGRGGRDISNLDTEWNVGLAMSIPIVDGGAANARMAVATGQLTSLEAAHERLRQDIALEIRRTLADITNARERIRITELNMLSAEENRRVAIGRYEAGAGSPFEVTDALLSYTDARLENRRARYDLQLALVALEIAVGREI